eukprot:GHVU01113506.1.p1 GENE.GHVU01113506.1~~GHVU01113506.1.p1  ORF type:complete len:103 (+),score=2.90 GHVU01113506.1:100-408(+)
MLRIGLEPIDTYSTRFNIHTNNSMMLYIYIYSVAIRATVCLSVCLSVCLLLCSFTAPLSFEYVRASPPARPLARCSTTIDERPSIDLSSTDVVVVSVSQEVS